LVLPDGHPPSWFVVISATGEREYPETTREINLPAHEGPRQVGDQVEVNKVHALEAGIFPYLPFPFPRLSAERWSHVRATRSRRAANGISLPDWKNPWFGFKRRQITLRLRGRLSVNPCQLFAARIEVGKIPSVDGN
jgi:hypothetical protein